MLICYMNDDKKIIGLKQINVKGVQVCLKKIITFFFYNNKEVTVGKKMLTLDSGLWPQKLNVLTLIKTRFARKNYV